MRRQCVSMVAVVAAVLIGAPCSAQQRVPVRVAGAIEAVTRDTFASIFGIHELSDGHVIVNDAGGRRLLFLDSSLRTSAIIADTVTGGRGGYGLRGSAIVPFPGDSTLFVDIPSRGFVMITPQGTIARTLAAPRTNDVNWMANPNFGQAGIDAHGRLVYRAYPEYRERDTAAVGVQLDSAPVVRADFETRGADTIALLGIPAPKAASQTLPDGRKLTQLMVNPLPLIDDWTMLPDGTVAVLRGQDYHLDWIDANGVKTSSPKMPFDWKRLTEDEKVAIVDSTKRVLDAVWAANQAAIAAGSPGASAVSGASASVGAAGAGGAAGPDFSRLPPPPRPAPVVFPARDLPDYIPPVLHQGFMHADLLGNVWILPSTSAQGGTGLLYDVVNRKGEIIERVRLPDGRALVGFGAHGTMYLTARDSTGTHLERRRIPQ